MTLNELESDLYRRLGFAADPDPVVTTRLRAYLNQAHRQILSQKGLQKLRHSIVTATSFPGDPYLAMSPSAARVVNLVDRANRRLLRPVSLIDIREADPALTNVTSIPHSYAILGLVVASARPSSVAGFSVTSNSTLDDPTKTVHFEVAVPPAAAYVDQVALNGTTVVDVPYAWQVGTFVTKFYLGRTVDGGPASATGWIQLHQGTGGTGAVIAQIQPGHSAASLTRIQLYPTPQTAITYHADIELHVAEMSVGGDEPLLPEDFHWVLTSGALLKEWQRMEKTAQYDREKAMYREGVGDLKMFVARAGKEDGKNGNGNGLHDSSFGPWYPVGGMSSAAPHAPTHEPGGNDPMSVDALPAIGSLRTLGSGPNQAAPGDDPRFTSGGGGPHHLTHESGGSDALSVILLAGYPGGTTGFLRADATFATPATGGGAHHATHEPGGADPMAVDAAAAVGSLRTLGAGANQAAPGNDTRFTAAPQLHAPTHKSGGTDAIKLDELAAPTDVTTLNASTTAHGLLRKLSNVAMQFLDGQGGWTVPTNVPGLHATTHQPGGADPMAVDAVAATGSLRTLGTGSQQAAAGNDARLTNARTPTPHETTHRAGGSDPLQVTLLAGYPSNPGLFLDGTGNFTVPGGVVPGAHHVTHEPGGTDALVNAAWTHQSNTFAEVNTFAKQVIIDSTNPALFLYEADQPANAKRWQVVPDTQTLRFRALDDTGVSLSVPLALDRGGTATIGNNLNVTGSGGNVACKDQANTFTQQQTISLVYPRLQLSDTAQVADARKFEFQVYGQQMLLVALNDAESAYIATPLTLNRSGDVKVGRDVYEKGRATPLGHWTAVPYSAGNFGGLGGMTWTVDAGDVAVNRYTVVGKTLFWNLQINTSTIGGTPYYLLTATIPTGFTLATVAPLPAPYAVSGGAAVRVFPVVVSGTQIGLQQDTGANWAGVNNVAVWVTVIIEVA